MPFVYENHILALFDHHFPINVEIGKNLVKGLIVGEICHIAVTVQLIIQYDNIGIKVVFQLFGNITECEVAEIESFVLDGDLYWCVRTIPG